VLYWAWQKGNFKARPEAAPLTAEVFD
jgi:hypothetical protein